MKRTKPKRKSNPYDDPIYKMPWGKFKGEKLANTPADYFIYMYDMGYLKGGLKRYVEDNMGTLLGESRDGGCDATESDIY